MKVLSLWEPWATLIAVFAKRVETRSWDLPRVPVDIAIHAAKSTKGLGFCYEEPFRSTLLAHGIKGPSDFQLGRILCVARVHSVYRTEQIIRTNSVSKVEQAFGDYGAGRFGWFLSDVRRLPKPLPFSGGQGLTKEVPDDVIAAALAGEAVRL